MRNGLNISNVSELVHEMRSVPEEAEVRYHAQVNALPDRFVGCAQTARAGTIRVARDFRIEGARPGSRATDDLPSPLEYLQTAVGGCVMVTFVYGGSAKGVTLSNFTMESVAELRRGPAGEDLVALRYILDVDADCDDKTVTGIARYVSFLSPNHRTVIEPNELALQLVVRGDDQRAAERAITVGADAASAEFPDLVDEIRCALRWQYGTQFAGHVVSTSRDGRRPVAVDQPKQYLGIDKSPNPQEYLMMALGMDIAAGLGSADTPPHRVAISLGGNLDLRGVLNVDPEAEVRVHQVGGTLELEVDGDPAPWLDRVEQVVQRSAVRRLLCNPKKIDIEVRARGEKLLIFPSHQRLLKMFRKAGNMP